MALPQIIESAKLRIERGESFTSAASWVWDMSTSENKQAVDAYLVAARHPLAMQPGTPEQRFRCLLIEATDSDAR